LGRGKTERERGVSWENNAEASRQTGGKRHDLSRLLTEKVGEPALGLAALHLKSWVRDVQKPRKKKKKVIGQKEKWIRVAPYIFRAKKKKNETRLRLGRNREEVFERKKTGKGVKGRLKGRRQGGEQKRAPGKTTKWGVGCWQGGSQNHRRLDRETGTEREDREGRRIRARPGYETGRKFAEKRHGWSESKKKKVGERRKIQLEKKKPMDEEQNLKRKDHCSTVPGFVLSRSRDRTGMGRKGGESVGQNLKGLEFIQEEIFKSGF